MSLGNTICSCSRRVKKMREILSRVKDKYKNYEYPTNSLLIHAHKPHKTPAYNAISLSLCASKRVHFYDDDLKHPLFFNGDTNNTAERAQRKWQKENGGEMMNLPPLNPLRRLRRAKKREDLRPPRIRPPPPPLPKKEDDERRRRRRRETTTT